MRPWQRFGGLGAQHLFCGPAHQQRFNGVAGRVCSAACASDEERGGGGGRLRRCLTVGARAHSRRAVAECQTFADLNELCHGVTQQAHCLFHMFSYFLFSCFRGSSSCFLLGYRNVLWAKASVRMASWYVCSVGTTGGALKRRPIPKGWRGIAE